MTTGSEIEREFSDLEQKIAKLKTADKQLVAIEATRFGKLFSSEITSLKRHIKNPHALPYVEQQLETIASKVKGFEQAQTTLNRAKQALADAETQKLSVPAECRSLIANAEALVATTDFKKAPELAERALRLLVKNREEAENTHRSQEQAVQRLERVKQQLQDAAARRLNIPAECRSAIAAAEQALQAYDSARATAYLQKAERLLEQCRADALRTEKEKAEAGIRSAQSLVEKIIKLGLKRPDTIVELLRKASQAMDSEDYTIAAAHARDAAIILQENLQRYETASRSIEKAESYIRETESILPDAALLTEKVKSARIAQIAGSFEQAMKLAEQVAADGQRLLERVAGEEMQTSKTNIDKAKTFGNCNLAEPERLLAQAGEAVKQGDYRRAISLARDAGEKARKIKEEAVPAITVSFSATDFEPDTWVDVELAVKNTGLAHARDVTLSFPGRVETEFLKNVPELNSGETAALRIRLKPRDKGKVPVTIDLSFKDIDGKQYTARQTVDIMVGSKTTPRGIFPPQLNGLYASPEPIGRGGFGRVFRVMRRKDNKMVAVKVPLESDPGTGDSFLRDILNWRRLDHDNIIKLESSNIFPVVYLEAELGDQSLDEMAKPFIVDRAAYTIMEVARGLAHAHGKGVWHLDLKPANILLVKDVPKISDWGLSRVSSERQSGSAVNLFTPAYSAPEQHDKQTFGPLDARTDIFQLGIVFYELVTGELPFRGDTPLQLSHAITSEDAKPPSSLNPEAIDVEPIILKCLQKRKRDRYQSISEIQVDLAGYLGIDFKKSLTVSRGRLEKTMLCCDLVEVYAENGNCQKSILYLKNLQGFVTGARLQQMIQDEVETLENYALRSVSMAERLSNIREIIHHSRYGE